MLGTMPLSVDLGPLPPPAKKALSPDAPAPLKAMAAKGALPGAKPADVIAVLAGLSAGPEAALAATARQTLSSLPEAMLIGAMTAELQPAAALALAEHHASKTVLVERLLRLPQLPDEALELLAERADEAVGELIATNEQRLLSCPTVIEKLYMNKRVRMSTSDRLLELAVRNKLVLSLPAYDEMVAAIEGELIPEASNERLPDDEVFLEVLEHGEAVTAAIGEDGDLFESDEEGEEKLKEASVPIFARWPKMTVTAKIRAATLGTSAERLLAVRDTNRLVATAAVKSPMLRENEAVQISASRSVSEEVLRHLSLNREMTRSYRVKLNLVLNPRTPFTFTARMLPHLRENDVRAIMKSKNVPSAVQAAARRQLTRKSTGK